MGIGRFHIEHDVRPDLASLRQKFQEKEGVFLKRGLTLREKGVILIGYEKMRLRINLIENHSHPQRMRSTEETCMARAKRPKTHTLPIPGGTTSRDAEDTGAPDLFNLKLGNVDDPSPSDLALVQKLASNHIPLREICAILDVPESLFNSNLTLMAAVERGHEIGKAQLRVLQSRSAATNPIMQIWLGKNVLGQADKIETKHEHKDDDDARSGFADKLKSIIDISPTRRTDGDANRGREGSGPVRVESLGEKLAITADERVLAEAGDDAAAD